MGKPENVPAHPSRERDDEHPGYEIQDVNVGGIITFLAGLCGSLVVFFFLCWGLGKAINAGFAHSDAKPDKWQTNMSQMGGALRDEKGRDLTSNATLEQENFTRMANAFPGPRLETDDGNQDTADLHANEDLLLSFYSRSPELQNGAIRIPIDRAMELVVQRGLGTPAAAAQPKQLMAGESAPSVAAPLTDGFARTGYELETIAAREQKLEMTKAEK